MTNVYKMARIMEAKNASDQWNFFLNNSRLEEVRKEEFRRLKGETYLDHTGSTLYSEKQVAEHLATLQSGLYGNPHSGSSGQQTSALVEQARYRFQLDMSCLSSKGRIVAIFKKIDHDVDTYPAANTCIAAVCYDVIGDIINGVLSWFGVSAEDYSVIFTSGATAALKIVADCFHCDGGHSDCNKGDDCLQLDDYAERDDYNKGQNEEKEKCKKQTNQDYNDKENYYADSAEKENDRNYSKAKENYTKTDKQQALYVYLEDNHTSVIGVREVLRTRGIQSECLPIHDADNEQMALSKMAAFLEKHQPDEQSNNIATKMQKEDSVGTSLLFSYAAQSNFSGRRYKFLWLTRLREILSRNHGNLYILLDAASFVTSSQLNLRESLADFVTISFYKIFGYPTGLGALLVKNSSAHVLKKTYFGGGTVQVSLATEDFHVFRTDICERFEDGTLPFLDILALEAGFRAVERISGTYRGLHSFVLAKYLYTQLVSLRHANGSKVAKLYCHSPFVAMETQGPIVTFNLMRADGSFIGYSQVDKLAEACNIHVRVGCFCNLGACRHHLGLSSNQVKRNFKAGHVCGDDLDLVEGQPTGAVRVSFGYMSTLRDAVSFVNFVKECFVEGPVEAIDPENDPVLMEVIKDVERVCKNTLKSENLTEVNVEACYRRNEISFNSGNNNENSNVELDNRVKIDNNVNTAVRVTETQVKSETSLTDQAGSTVSSHITQTSPFRTPLTLLEGAANHVTVSHHPPQLRPLTDAQAKSSLSTAEPSKSSSHYTALANQMTDSKPPALPRSNKVISKVIVHDDVTNKVMGHDDVINKENDHYDVSNDFILQNDLINSHSEREVKGQTDSDLKHQTDDKTCTEGQAFLKDIFLYPIKSCGALRVGSWPVGTRGLLYDRCWMIVTSAGVAVTQKQVPNMCTIRPHINRDLHTLTLTCQGLEDISIPLEQEHQVSKELTLCQSKVCGDRVIVEDCGDTVAEWLADALGRADIRLVKQHIDSQRISKRQPATEGSSSQTISLSNEAQFLLINTASVNALQQRALQNVSDNLGDLDSVAMRFRANLVVDGSWPAFHEESVQSLHTGRHSFTSQGGCTRCQMICVNQQTGEKNSQPLRSLASMKEKKMKFGILLQHEAVRDTICVLSCGDVITVVMETSHNAIVGQEKPDSA